MSYIPKDKRKGFTIVELLVSVAIMVVISAVVAGSQSTYTSGASLKNVANDLGLSLRQAQIYGISVKELGAGNFNVGYGISFNLSPAPFGDDKSFIFFADNDEVDSIYTGTWDCPPESECLDKTLLTAGNFVNKVCAITSTGEDCDGNRLDISFVRPAIEAKIYYDEVSTGVIGARVELLSIDGKENSVTVYTTGQISVQ